MSLVLCLLMQSVVYAAPSFPSLTNLWNQNLKINFVLPQSIGHIEDSYKAPNSEKTIVLIQDAHTNASAQLNIAKMLDIILAEEDIDLVFLEAGNGDLSLSDLRQDASLNHRKQVGLKYIKKGLLQGSEYFDLTTKREFKLWGVESRDLYNQSLEIYKSVVDQRADFKAYLAKVKITTDLLKEKLFNPALQKLDQQRIAYQNGDLSFVEYVSFIAQLDPSASVNVIDDNSPVIASREAGAAISNSNRLKTNSRLLPQIALRNDGLLKNHPNLQSILKLASQESLIDFDKANEEYQMLIESRHSVIARRNDEAISDSTGLKVDPRLLRRYAPRNDEVSIQGMISNQHIDSNLYPNLAVYADYLKQTKKLDATRTLDELNALERDVFSSLTQSRDESGLLTLSKSVSILEGLIELQLQPDAYQKIIANPSNFDLETITGFLNQKILELKDHQDKAIFLDEEQNAFIQQALGFYDLTLQRDQAFVRNTIQKMDIDEESEAILITGGYHANNLKAQFKQRGISFISIIPNITHETNSQKYEKLLLSQGTNAQESKPMNKSTMSLRPAAEPASRISLRVLRQELLRASIDHNANILPNTVQLQRDESSRMADSIDVPDSVILPLTLLWTSMDKRSFRDDPSRLVFELWFGPFIRENSNKNPIDTVTNFIIIQFSKFIPLILGAHLPGLFDHNAVTAIRDIALFAMMKTFYFFMLRNLTRRIFRVWSNPNETTGTIETILSAHIKDLNEQFEILKEDSRVTDKTLASLDSKVKKLQRLRFQITQKSAKPRAIALTWDMKVRVYFKEPYLRRILLPIIHPITTYIMPLEDWRPVMDRVKAWFLNLDHPFQPEGVPVRVHQRSKRDLASLVESAEFGARMVNSMAPLDYVGIRSLLNELVLEMNWVLDPHDVQLFIGDDTEILGNQGYIIGESTPVIESNPPRAIDYYQISVDLGRIDVEQFFVELESQFGQFELADDSEWNKIKAGFRTSRLRTELRKANHIVRKSEYDEAAKFALEADVAVYPKDYAGKILARIAKEKAAEVELVQKTLEKESKDAFANLKKEANRLGIRVFHFDTKESLTPRVTKAQIAESAEIDITKSKLKKLDIRTGRVRSLDKLWPMLQLHDLTVFPNLKTLAMQYKRLRHYKHVESITHGGFDFNLNDPNLHTFLGELSQSTSVEGDVMQLTPRKVMNTGAVRIGQYKGVGASKDQDKHLQYQVMQKFAGQWVIPVIRRIGDGEYDIEFDVKSKLTGKRFMVAKYAFVRNNKVWVKKRKRLMTFSSSPLAREYFSGFSRDNLPQVLKLFSYKKGEEYGLFKKAKIYFWQSILIRIPANIKSEELILKVHKDNKGEWIASTYLRRNSLRPEVWLKSVYLTKGGQPAIGFGKSASFEGYKHIKGLIPRPSNRVSDRAKDYQNIDWIARGVGEPPIEDDIEVERLSDPGLYSWKGNMIRPSLGAEFAAGTTRREWVAFDMPRYPDARGVVYTNSDHPDKPIAHLLYYNNRFHDPQALDYETKGSSGDLTTFTSETGSQAETSASRMAKRKRMPEEFGQIADYIQHQVMLNPLILQDRSTKPFRQDGSSLYFEMDIEDQNAFRMRRGIKVSSTENNATIKYLIVKSLRKGLSEGQKNPKRLAHLVYFEDNMPGKLAPQWIMKVYDVAAPKERYAYYRFKATSTFIHSFEILQEDTAPRMAKSIMEANAVDEVLALMDGFERSLKAGRAFDGLLPVGLEGKVTDSRIARPREADQIWKNMMNAYEIDAADPRIYLEGFAIKITQLYADAEQSFEELHPFIDKMRVLVDLYNESNEFAPRPLYLEELLIHPTSIPLENRTFVKWTNALAHYPDWIARKIVLVRLFNTHNHILYFLNAEMHDYEDAQAIKSLLSKGMAMAKVDTAIRRVVVGAVVSILVRHEVDRLQKMAPDTWGVIKDNAVILEQWIRDSRLEDAYAEANPDQKQQISTMGLAIALFRFLEASLSKYETRESVVEIIESQELLRKLTENEDTVIVTSKDKALQVMGSELSSDGDIRFLTLYDQFYEIALDKLKSTRMADVQRVFDAEFQKLLGHLGAVLMEGDAEKMDISNMKLVSIRDAGKREGLILHEENETVFNLSQLPERNQSELRYLFWKHYAGPIFEDVVIQFWDDYFEKASLDSQPNFLISKLYAWSEARKYRRMGLGKQLFKGKRILELGMGVGRHLLAMKYLGARRVVGIDGSQQALNAVEALAQAYNGNKGIGLQKVRLLELDDTTIDDGEPFDYVLIDHMFHYIPAPLRPALIQAAMNKTHGEGAIIYIGRETAQGVYLKDITALFEGLGLNTQVLHHENKSIVVLAQKVDPKQESRLATEPAPSAQNSRMSERMGFGQFMRDFWNLKQVHFFKTFPFFRTFVFGLPIFTIMFTITTPATYLFPLISLGLNLFILSSMSGVRAMDVIVGNRQKQSESNFDTYRWVIRDEVIESHDAEFIALVRSTQELGRALAQLTGQAREFAQKIVSGIELLELEEKAGVSGIADVRGWMDMDETQFDSFLWRLEKFNRFDELAIDKLRVEGLEFYEIADFLDDYKQIDLIVIDLIDKLPLREEFQNYLNARRGINQRILDFVNGYLDLTTYVPPYNSKPRAGVNYEERITKFQRHFAMMTDYLGLSDEPANGARLASSDTNQAARMSHDGVYRPEDDEYWDRIAKLILWTAVHEIHQANKEKHKVKTGGHQAASASSLHIMVALELIHKSGVDYIAHKPHAAPIYHAIQYLLGNLDKELLYRLRETAIDPEPVFDSKPNEPELSDKQRLDLKRLIAPLVKLLPESARSQFDTLGLHSYPGMIDPLDIDIPTGSVGIGPAATIALAIVQKWLKAQDFEVADSHFYATVGDGEFGEGNYLEALSMAAEFEVNNITHIVDFNRLSLDGVMHERTFERIKQTYEANGWRVISLKWGRLMQAAFERHDGGELYMNVIGDLKQQEYELLTAQKPSYIRKYLIDRGAQGLEEFLSIYDDEELYALVTDLGGHDFYNLVRAMNEAKADQTKPVAIIAYTHKGWGIDPLIGNPASHGLLLTDDQIEDLRISLQIDSEDDFPIFDKASTESQILESIKQRVSEQRDARKETKRTNSEASFPKELIDNLPDRLMPKASIIKDVPTQVHMGTIIGMMRRIADTPEEELETDTERALRPIAERYLTVSPDVATSTQLGPGLDQNIFGPEQDRNWFETVELGRALDDKKMKSTPDTTRILKGARHFEVGIAEMNALTMAIALGKSKDFVGTALFPLVTVYDMFLFRRALDIAFYGQYWLSNFLMIGTPSGSSLAPEGAQHQSGIAPVIGRSLVNTITWEPAFPQELEYIEADRLKRVVTENTKGRNAVYYRLSTVPVKKAELINQLQDQAKYQDLDEASIMDLWGQDVLKGGYRLVDYSNQADYDPDFNVVNLVTTGAMMNEALLASDALRESKNRTYANVIIVSSPNLILGALGEKTGFEQLKALIPASERAFTPVVTVADAPTAYLSGIADVLGLGLGVEALGLIKNGTSARDIERIYMHHGISRVHIAVTAQKQLMFRDDGDGRVQHFIESDWGSDPDAPRMARDYDFSIHQDMLVSLMSLAGVEGGFPEWGKQTRLTPEQFMRGKRVLNIGVETFDGLRGGGKINPRNLVSHYKELGIDITGLTRAISENDDDAQLVLGDARAMPFEDNSFDMAISINFYDDIYIQLMLMLQNEIVEVKHYSEFYTRIAQEVRRVLVEGGQYLVSNVDGEMFKNVMIPIFESHGFEVIRPLAELVSGEGTYLFVNHKETINESALTELDNIPDSRMTDIESLEQINPQFSNESLGYSMTIVDKKRISRIFALGNYSDENQATQDLNVVGVFAATLVALPTLLGLNLIAEVQMGLLALSFTLALGVFGLIPYLSVRDNIKYGADQLSYWISLVYLPLLEISSIGSLLGQAQQNTPLMWRVLLPGFLALTVMTRHVFFIHEQDNRRPFNHVNDNELNQLTEGSTAIIFDKEALDPGAPWLDKLRSYKPKLFGINLEQHIAYLVQTDREAFLLKARVMSMLSDGRIRNREVADVVISKIKTQAAFVAELRKSKNSAKARMAKIDWDQVDVELDDEYKSILDHFVARLPSPQQEESAEFLTHFTSRVNLIADRENTYGLALAHLARVIRDDPEDALHWLVFREKTSLKKLEHERYIGSAFFFYLDAESDPSRSIGTLNRMKRDLEELEAEIDFEDANHIIELDDGSYPLYVNFDEFDSKHHAHVSRLIDQMLPILLENDFRPMMAKISQLDESRGHVQISFVDINLEKRNIASYILEGDAESNDYIPIVLETLKLNMWLINLFDGQALNIFAKEAEMDPDEIMSMLRDLYEKKQIFDARFGSQTRATFVPGSMYHDPPKKHPALKAGEMPIYFLLLNDQENESDLSEEFERNVIGGIQFDHNTNSFGEIISNPRRSRMAESLSLPQGVGDFDGVAAIPYGISMDGTQVALTATTRLLNQDDLVFKGALIRNLEELSSSAKVGEAKPSVLVIGAGAGPLIADYHARFGNDLDITFMNKERIQMPSVDLKLRLPEAFGNVTDAELDGFQAYLTENILIHDAEQGLTQGSIIEDRKFDRIIVSSRTLEYMRDPLKVIYDIKNHLRVGGEAFINELLFLENEKIGGVLIEGGLSLRDFFDQYNLDGNRPEFRVQFLFGDLDDRYYGLHIINLNPTNNIQPAYKIQSQTPIYGSEADMRIQGTKTTYYNTAPPIAPGADPARLAANLTPIEMAVDLTEALSDFGDEGILRDNREAVAIFLNGLHASKPSYFDGRRLLMLGSTKLYPGIRLDDEGREVFTLTGMDDILAEFPIGVNEAEEIAKKHQSEVRALNQKYVHGSAIAYVLAERESRRGYETLVNRVDASGIRQAIPKAVILKSSIIDLDMPRALLQQQLRLFIATFKKIQQAAPSTTFHFDAGFVGYADAIKAISQEYGIDSFVSLEEPTATIQVIIDSLSVVDVNGILVDIDQIQANELALGLPKAIYQGLKEAALFTNVETKQLDFESSDPIEITRLRHQRNESSKEPIESDNEYIELISGSMSITRRQRHIWNAIIPIPMDYMLKAAQRTIQQTVQST